MTPGDSSWVNRAKAAGLIPIAERMGFKILRGGSISPCPSCRAEFRSSRGHDKRGPVGLTPDGQGWRCHRCGAGGDAIALAAFVITGTDKPAEWGPVWEALDRSSVAPAQTAPAPRPLIKGPVRPSQAEVQDLWARARPVTQDAEVAAWLSGRGIDPWLVEDRDLARALPRDAVVPAWARLLGRPWPMAGYRVLLRMFDGSGRFVTLHARNVRRDLQPKGAFPSGFQVTGTVMADEVGLRLLQTENLIGALWIVEGAPDFLTTGTTWGDAAEDPPGVLGIVSGSWTADIARRVPSGTGVIIAVHHDDAGQRYARKISEGLASRAELWRWTPVVRRTA